MTNLKDKIKKIFRRKENLEEKGGRNVAVIGIREYRTPGFFSLLYHNYQNKREYHSGLPVEQ